MNAPCAVVERSTDGTLTIVVADLGTVYNSADFHANAIHYNPTDDSYTVSDRNPNLFVKLTRRGQLVWQLGGKNPKDPAQVLHRAGRGLGGEPRPPNSAERQLSVVHQRPDAAHELADRLRRDLIMEPAHGAALGAREVVLQKRGEPRLGPVIGAKRLHEEAAFVGEGLALDLEKSVEAAVRGEREGHALILPIYGDVGKRATQAAVIFARRRSGRTGFVMSSNDPGR